MEKSSTRGDSFDDNRLFTTVSVSTPSASCVMKEEVSLTDLRKTKTVRLDVETIWHEGSNNLLCKHRCSYICASVDPPNISASVCSVNLPCAQKRVYFCQPCYFECLQVETWAKPFLCEFLILFSFVCLFVCFFFFGGGVVFAGNCLIGAARLILIRTTCVLYVAT